MQLKHTLLFSALALSSAAATANTYITPTFYGDILGQVRWEDNQDYQSEIQRATAGIKGKHKTDLVTILYKLEGEYSEDLTKTAPEDQDFDIRVSEANLVLVNKSLGGIFFGNGTTGTYKDLYSRVDIFESNNMHLSSNVALFRQGKNGNNQLAYMTPKWNNIYAKVAVISPNNNNEQDVDIFGLRLLYVTENFDLVLNRAQIDEKQMPGNQSEPYVRYALSSSYTTGNFYAGGLVELNIDDPQGDSTIYGVSGKYSLDKLTFKLGAQYKNFEDALKEDETLYLASATYAFDQHFSTYLELAEYAEDGKGNGENRNDNINLGLNLKF
ncbi:porin [Photobacterium alginatilyticum]|uniref:Porin n=1 Tax=Photobacterium alginatilyticum TaxID=1775171 RepID=A0ABW9YPV2_9GAMM|nr:porin [Photobacterium alginatilyticum]NBI55526.1 porin [Photobacterium alginatilyticum]